MHYSLDWRRTANTACVLQTIFKVLDQLIHLDIFILVRTSSARVAIDQMVGAAVHCGQRETIQLQTIASRAIMNRVDMTMKQR